MNKIVNIAVKCVITASCVVACREIVGFHVSPFKASASTRLMSDIAGGAIGFVLGKELADEIVYSIDGAVEAYKGFGGIS